MNVLGIETSCDETAVSIVRDGRFVLSNIVSSSIKFHKKYGGVIPEIASRLHLETIGYVLDESLKESKVNLEDIDLVAVTSQPGLKGSLLVGGCFAKAIAFALNIPLLKVDHLHAHIYAAFLVFGAIKEVPKPERLFPFIGLVVSGGHTSLFYVKDFTKIEPLGSTLDDACGEAFDKVAKILNLGYPGGPLIEKLAKRGNSQKVRFGTIRTQRPLDFSFSGIKTAVLYMIENKFKIKGRKALSFNEKRDIAASFQEAVIESLIEKAFLACRKKGAHILVIGGGVAANNRLREKFSQKANLENLTLYTSALEFCTDNAAMVGGLGYMLFKRGRIKNLVNN